MTVGPSTPQRCHRENAVGLRCNGTGGHLGDCDCSPFGPAHRRWDAPVPPVPDPREPIRLCARFVEAGVRYAIVGGWAAVLQGVRRVPHDLDVAVLPWHLPRIDSLVADLGYQYAGPLEVHDPGTPRERRCRKMLRDLGDGRCAALDFIAADGPFGGVIDRSYVLDGMRTASREDLIRTKRLAGRPIDLRDLLALNA